VHAPADVVFMEDGAPVPADRRQWLGLESENFDVYAQLTREEIVGLAQMLEHARVALPPVLWPGRARPPEARIRVVAVRDLERFGGAPPGYPGGLAQADPSLRQLGPAPLMVLKVRPDSLDWVGFAAVHTLCHLMIGGLGLDVPDWLNEGLASYFEAAILDRTKGSAQIGTVARTRMHMLERYPRVGPRELFEWEVTGWKREEYSSYSSSAFVLVHQLQVMRGPQFRRFQERLGAGARWREAWEAELGPLDDPALQREAAEFWMHARFKTHTVPAPFPAVRVGQPAPMQQADVHALQALLHHHAPGPMSQEQRQRWARVELEYSLARDRLNPLALEAGWPFYTPEERKVRARSTWQAHPSNWRVAVLAASSVSDSEAVTILERTRGLLPTRNYAYLEAGLALAYWGIQRYAEARLLARQAVDRAPTDAHLLGVYGQCLIAASYCEAGREAIAQALVGTERGKPFPYDLAWLKRVCEVP
jgi:hypothetical protein